MYPNILDIVYEQTRLILFTTKLSMSLIKHHSIKYEYTGEWRYSSTYSKPWHWMEMSGQLHTLTALTLAKIHHWIEAKWTPDPV
jgi:hypothetical protein